MLVAALPHSPKALHLKQYLDDLKAFDWHFEHSDDQQVWRRGTMRLAVLKLQAAVLDPDFKIWNSIAPKEYQQ